jgi:hypothetical protein
LLLLSVSCSYVTSKGLVERYPTKAIVINNYFSDNEMDYVYRANINIHKHHLSGIFIIKKIDTNHYRLVFTQEFGNKIFDFELIEDSVRVNYMIENFNKKQLSEVLIKDFQILVKRNNSVINEFYSQTDFVYRSVMNNNYNYHFYSKSNNNLEKIVMTAKKKELLSIDFRTIENNVAKDIVMTHHNSKIKFVLKYINN